METGTVDRIGFHFDVMCPWAYQASVWIRDVRAQRDVEVDWRFFSLEEINRSVTSDSVAYLSHEGMMQAVGNTTNSGYCSACFTGKYPVALGQGADLVTLRRARG